MLSMYRGGSCQDKASKIHQLLQLNHEYGRFNGVVLVSEDRNIILKKGYGFANMEWNIPNIPETKFRLGSITKQFTAMLVMQQVQSGKINLEATISDYLPAYRIDIGNSVTIHQLLTHTSGIPNYTSLPTFREISRRPWTVSEFVAECCSGDLEFQPGSKFLYSNSGYFLLGAILEEVTGKTYEELLQGYILHPVGMENSGHDHQQLVLKNRASGYYPTAFGYDNADYSDMSVPYAAGAMYSTAEDLYLWHQALCSEDLLSQEHRDIMFTAHQSGYAYGWWHDKLAFGSSHDSVEVVWHAGGIRGFYSLITRQLDGRNLVVLLNNTAKYDVSELRDITVAILGILHDKPYDLPSMSGLELLRKTIREEGVSAAVDKYRNLKDDTLADFEFREFELNWLGYQLLDRGLIDEAVTLFELIVQEYPDSYNAYDSLGDAFRRKGAIDSAIRNYQKSLQLNPDYKDAEEKLNAISRHDQMRNTDH